MRVLFWGTPEFAVGPLMAVLAAGREIVGVVTRPDRPRGRGRRTVAPSPVKRRALELGIPVLTPELPRGEAFLSELRALGAEISVVVAYGHILPPGVLELPPRGSINLHASLLPEFRGAAPIQWAIIRGARRTGVTVMRMTAGMDEGPILLSRSLRIGEEETASRLAPRLSALGEELLPEALTGLEGGTLAEVEQDHARATYAPKVDRETARIEWGRGAPEIHAHVRGMDAVPGAWTPFRGAPVKLFGPRTRDGGSPAPPGTVLRRDPGEGLVVQAGRGAVLFTGAQPAGRRRMEAGAWLRGGGPAVGERLG